jgi:hypothetical protein
MTRADDEPSDSRPSRGSVRGRYLRDRGAECGRPSHPPQLPRTRYIDVKTSAPLGLVATELGTDQGGTDANKRDVATQVGRLNVADMQL